MDEIGIETPRNVGSFILPFFYFFFIHYTL